ncbi:hypothetical protein ANCCAN_21452 [Ancylostoma caninum]|uniref:PH domain-containing protein n=1 Tax=Ancylostoma caninum TaxID=29170 RepID=A0A368FKH7_ANCCA|nr:hypothetical protein ANCCAN_21452 [Ancylostoma caninum]
MTRCHRVCEADSITGNSHSILMAFKADGDSTQPSIVYVKADTTDEIRWWQNLLNMYAKQNTIQVRPRRQITEEKYEPIAVSLCVIADFLKLIAGNLLFYLFFACYFFFSVFYIFGHPLCRICWPCDFLILDLFIYICVYFIAVARSKALENYMCVKYTLENLGRVMDIHN